MSGPNTGTAASEVPGTRREEGGSAKRKHLFDDRKNVKWAIRSLFICCAILFLGDVVFLFEHKHLSFEEGAFPIEGWFGFYGIYGFVACVLLVLAAKQMRKFLMREEDYYEH